MRIAIQQQFVAGTSWFVLVTVITNDQIEVAIAVEVSRLHGAGRLARQQQSPLLPSSDMMSAYSSLPVKGFDGVVH